MRKPSTRKKPNWPLTALRHSTVATAVAACFSGSLALANPTNPTVVNGVVGIAQAGNILNITNSPNAIINWGSFSIGVNELTRFLQQSASSAVLNRVIGQDPSAILGALQSNGRVLLLNPNGIVFGAGSQVDVAGLVASTLNLSNDDFLNNRMRFTDGAGAGSVVNQGNLTGGSVYLIGNAVTNNGIITSPQGEVILAAGNSVELVSPGTPNLRVEIVAPDNEARNLGTITADAGRIGIYAGLINHSGTLNASSAVVEGGRIVLKATKLANLDAGSVTSVSGTAGGVVDVQSDVLINAGSINADGAQGGSVVVQARNVLSAGRISADGAQGAGGEVNVQASSRILQTAAAHLSADGEAGGGKVTLQAADRVFGSGTLTATGQGAGSTGGEIKVLANDIVLLGARIDASGDAGGGTVLIGGDFQGNNPAVQNATTNWINFSTTINADARTAGDGGKVIVWSDNDTQFYGTVSARGGVQSGNGGFMEISGKETLTMGGFADAGAPNGTPGTLLLDPKNIIIDSAGGGGLASFLLADPNPGGGDGFADQVVVLPNNNVVATNYFDDFAASNAGAVYLFNGTTGALISSLTGSSADDLVGSAGITALGNGNYVVYSNVWANGAAADAGAVTWGSGTTGVSGVVSATNSLVGTTTNDSVGIGGITVLSNGNYVVNSKWWDNGGAADAGAVTWGSGTTGVSGVITASNSLVGTMAGNLVGVGGITALSNGNYVVNSYQWRGPTGNSFVGAVTWVNGANGQIAGGTAVGGAVSTANSLVGTTVVDLVGSGGVTALTNGNYVVRSPSWDGAAADVGAVTWVNGANGQIAGGTAVGGAVSTANSLVGSAFGDGMNGANTGRAAGVTVLTNGNYVVSSPNWRNAGVAEAGAATWVDGTNGQVFGATGPGAVISAANSLVGSTFLDAVGGQVIVLSNGNYVVVSPIWDNAGVVNAGAVTWGNGSGGTVGPVSVGNSLVGSSPFDEVGQRLFFPLANGNYVVASPSWNNGAVSDAGAATWVNGTNGRAFGEVSPGATISDANSLVGTTQDDLVGQNIFALTNGNYVVSSFGWNNGAASQAGAATWGNGSGGTVGPVSVGNSLVGTTTNDRVSSNGVAALTNGNYVVMSRDWDGAAVDVGAVTWGNGSTAGPRLVGPVLAGNSLVGSTAGDRVGTGVLPLTNGNYVVGSFSWNNGAATSAGAATWGNGSGGTVGLVSAGNSLVGTTTDDSVGISFTGLTNGNYVVGSVLWDNAGAVDAGAVTWGDGSTAGSRLVGAITADNSLVGTTTNDFVGGGFYTLLASGNYVITSPDWNNGAVGSVGAVTFGSGTSVISGPVSAANSLIGTTANDRFGSGGAVMPLSNGNVVVRSPLAQNGAFGGAGLVHVLSPGGGGAFTNPLTFADNAAGTTTITPAQITAITNTGTAVVLQANTDITLAAASDIITNEGGSGGALTMQAGRSIFLNSNITTDNGALTLSANDPGAISNRDAGNAIINIATGVTINTGTGALGMNTNGSSGAITNDGTVSMGGGSSIYGLFNNNGTVNITGYATLGTGKVWNNAGIVTISGTSGLLDLGDTGSATFNNLAGGTLNVNSTAGWSVISNPSAQDGVINNAGTITVNNSTSWEAAFNNLASGTLNISAGQFVSMQNGQSIAGAVNIGAGGTLWISEWHGTDTVFNGTTIGGTGALQVLGGLSPVARLTNVNAPGATLRLGSGGTVQILNGTSTFGALDAAAYGGGLSLSNGLFAQSAGNLTVPSGVNYSGVTGYVAQGGDLIVPGLVNAAGTTITLDAGAGGNLKVLGGGTVSGANVNLLGGNVIIGEATSSAPASVQATALLNIVTPGSFQLLGGVGTGASARASSTGAMTVSASGDVILTGGSGLGAFASLLGDPDVVLASVGGVIRMDAGSGSGAYAAIESVSPTSIYVNFPNLASGGYFVNGVESTVYDVVTGSGFIAGGSPAVLDSNLIITYGLATSSGGGISSGQLEAPTQILIVAMGESVTPPEPEQNKDIFEDIKNDKGNKPPLCK